MTARTVLEARLVAELGELRLEVELATRGTLVVAGPNGAGKTSLLLALLGALPARGSLRVGDAVLLDTREGVCATVEERRLGYVPQDYALFTHLDVRQNVEFALASAGVRDARARTTAVLAELGIATLASRRVQSLSGGEKQRVALARALSVEPRALLLDEPLAALDLASRREVRGFLAATLARLRLPALVVSHDPDEARALGERLLVLEAGRVSQSGTWEELARAPATRFVADFVAAARG